MKTENVTNRCMYKVNKFSYTMKWCTIALPNQKDS